MLVCDDGSTDETEEVFTRLSGEDPRVRYLSLPENHGTPAPARNLGIASSRGDWIAFLDSDDRWLPAKLAKQSEFFAHGGYDVVASDAERTSGGSYFGLQGRRELERREFLAHNPVIVSSAVARKSVLAAAGGFPTSALGYGIRGVEDYGLWMLLAYAGCRFLLLPDELVVYDDSARGRMSDAVYRQEAAAAAVRWRTWLKRPLDGAVLRSAVLGTVDAARWRFGRRVQ